MPAELVWINSPEQIAGEIADRLMHAVGPRFVAHLVRTSGPVRTRGGSLKANRGRRWPVKTGHSRRGFRTVVRGRRLGIRNQARYARYVDPRGRGGSIVRYQFNEWARMGGMAEAVKAAVRDAGRAP